MKTIRQGVFETNSSSCHSMAICPKSQFDLIGKEYVIFSDNVINADYIAEKSKISKEDAQKVFDAILQFDDVKRTENINDHHVNYGCSTPDEVIDYIIEEIEGASDEKEKEELSKKYHKSFCKYFDLSDELKEVFNYYTEESYSSVDDFYEFNESEMGLDTYERKYTTPNGEEIVIFGYYGHD